MSKMKLSSILLILMVLSNIRLQLIIEELTLFSHESEEDPNFTPEVSKHSRRNYTFYIEIFDINHVLLRVFQ